jgi:DNA-binding MarR family transcriptional regulator
VRESDRESNLSPQRLSLLSVLAFAGPKTVGELADAEQVSAPAISRILNGLEGEGLITRERANSDRRYVQVQATKKGRRIMDAARARRLERITARLESLRPEELKALAGAVEILERLED